MCCFQVGGLSGGSRNPCEKHAKFGGMCKSHHKDLARVRRERDEARSGRDAAASEEAAAVRGGARTQYSLGYGVIGVTGTDTRTATDARTQYSLGYGVIGATATDASTQYSLGNGIIGATATDARTQYSLGGGVIAATVTDA